MNAANFIVILFQDMVTTTPTFSNHHPDQLGHHQHQDRTLPQQKD